MAADTALDARRAWATTPRTATALASANAPTIHIRRETPAIGYYPTALKLTICITQASLEALRSTSRATTRTTVLNACPARLKLAIRT